MEAILLKLLVGVIGTVLAWGLGELSAWFRSKRQTDARRSAYEHLLSATANACAAIEQEFVRVRKAKGEWNSDTQRVAKTKAVARAVQMLGDVDATASALGMNRQGLEATIEVLVEAAVGAAKDTRV